MRKLGKKDSFMTESIEAYCTCACTCGCTCSCPCTNSTDFVGHQQLPKDSNDSSAMPTGYTYVGSAISSST